MKVPYNYLPFEFSNPNKIFADWRKLIKSTEFTLGSFVEQFEKQFSNYVGSKYCISTNNGTDALILSLKSLGIGKGDEIITVCNSFYATTGAIVAVGAKPIFVDCDDRYQINENEIEKKITKKTKAILPVHWAGASPNMYKISLLAKRKKLYLIEDACMGIGGSLTGKHPGTFGDIGAFSMHPLKSLNVMGDGGMVVTNNKKIFDWIKKYRNHGMVDRDHIDFWGVNMRIQPLQAIVAMHGIKKLNQVVKKRNINAKYYDNLFSSIKNKITVPKRIKGYIETFSLYMVLAEDRDALIKYLIKNNVEAKIHYPVPLHKQKAFQGKNKKFPISDSQAKKLLTLPVHQFINKKQIKYTFDLIYSFYYK